MLLILIVTIITTILLLIGSSLPFWPAAALIAGCLTAIAVITWRFLQRLRLLRHRIDQCQADWGSNVEHLGGLPIPLETQGLLMLTNEELLFESDNLSQSFALNKIVSILPLTAEQLRLLSDTKICAILGSSRCQSLSAAREHVRRSYGSLKNSTILLIHYHEGWQSKETMSLVIIALEQKQQLTRQLFQNEKIRQVTRKYRTSNIKATRM